ncbi:MAG: NAD(P)H-hydrate dehydratase [Firmicutes bacterium]|nr:NAD(P)H-hydrate dehydratase [Bacillota bacterium]
MKILGLTDRDFVHTVIRKRPRDIHKGDCGRILLICGSEEMAGAAVFATKAAIKSGSGLVFTCTDREIFPVLQISVPEGICKSWDKVKSDFLQYDAIAIGPGMGVSVATKDILETILTSYDKTLIIDADGLNTVAANEDLQQLVRETKARVIMTPHIGEAKRLLDGEELCWKDSEGKMDKVAIASGLIQKYGCIAVVKGAGTLVALSEADAYINTTGNPGMATAGSGDVLTGILTSFAGQGLTAEDAARAGVFVHGLAGDLAAAHFGEYGLTASDIANYVPFALKDLTV